MTPLSPRYARIGLAFVIAACVLALLVRGVVSEDLVTQGLSRVAAVAIVLFAALVIVRNQA